jgi:hypothetical protein
MITVKQIMELEPCDEYPESKVEELIGKGKTPLEMCDLKIPVHDIFWVLFSDEIIPDKTLHELACKFAEQSLKAERKAGREPHPDSWKAIKVKRQWLKSKATNKQLSAAESAAWSAVRSAAESAAESAAWSAAWSAQLKIVKKELLKLEKIKSDCA